MKFRIQSVFATTTLLLATSLAAAQANNAAQARATNILFIGNSFTFGHADPIMTYNAATVTDANNRGYGGIPAVFKQFTTQAGLHYNVTSETMPSQPLGYHVQNKADIISRPGWDIVILQGLSHEPLPPSHGGNPTNFFAGAADLTKLIRAKNPNAKIFLYETWASPAALKKQGYSPDMAGLTAMQDDLRRASFKAAFDQNLTDVLRGGDAILLATQAGIGHIDPKKIPEGSFDLWDTEDHRHASSHGSYLVAALIFEKVTGADPRKLSAAENTPAAALGIKPEHAALLHRFAHDTNQLPPIPRSEVATLNPATRDANSTSAIGSQTGSQTGSQPGSQTGSQPPTAAPAAKP